MAFSSPPNQADYTTFIRDVMGITTAQLPDNSPMIPITLSVAMEIVSLDLAAISSIIYPLAVYNLAGDRLINYTQDQSGQNFFATTRASFNIAGFVAGVVSATSDETTSETILTPDFMKNLTMSDLQYLKTPYGRQYMAFAQDLGTMWGIS